MLSKETNRVSVPPWQTSKMRKYSLNKKSNRRRGISFATALIVLFLFAHSHVKACTCAIAATPDTNIVKYELNDPRNPDCPCHAAQKKADEEYAKLQQQNNPDNNNPADHNPADNTDVNKNNNANVNSNSGSTGSSGSEKHYSRSNKELKKMMKWTRKMKRQLRNKNNGTKKGNHRLSSCFHF
jgi:hypothetical protein